MKSDQHADVIKHCQWPGCNGTALKPASSYCEDHQVDYPRSANEQSGVPTELVWITILALAVGLTISQYFARGPL